MRRTSISTRVLSVLITLVLLSQFVPASGIQYAFAEGDDNPIPAAAEGTTPNTTGGTNGQDPQPTTPNGAEGAGGQDQQPTTPGATGGADGQDPQSTTPGATDGTDGQDQQTATPAKDEANGQDQQTATPAKDGAGEPSATPQAVPSGTVTTQVEMAAGETADGDFTIGNGGVVFGPTTGTATIRNCTVTNNAFNDRKGGYSDTNGSAFIARVANSLAFDNVTINSAANTLVFNIWENCSLTAKNVTLSGSVNRDNTVPFLMIGKYPNGAEGTLTFTGGSLITGAKGSVIGGNNNSVIGGNNNSVINVDRDSTLTIRESDIKFLSGATIAVKSGATLVVDHTSLTDVKIDNSGTVNVTNSDLSNCVIKTRGGSTLNVSNSKLHDWNRSSQETMIHTDGNGATVNISSTEICNNKNSMPAGNPGASIIKVQNGTLNLSKVNAHDNRCETRGGAFYLTNSTLTIDDNSTFENNSAQFLGGVFYLESTSATIGASTFKNNGTKENQGSTNQGAAIYSGNTEGNTERLLQFNGTIFENNCAWRENGTGTVYIHGKNAVVEVNGAKFTGNEAYRRGGGLVVADNVHATIQDLNGDPTEFKGNKVDSGVDFSGGGLFVDTAFVKMQDAAIYGNSAPDAGGAVSTCSTGTAQVWSMHGAAIFDNTLTNAGAKVAHPDIANYQDLYVLTKNHRDVNTGELVDGRNNFNIDLQFELVERMFNGGLHRWGVKNLNTTQGGHTFHSLIAQSDATNKDVSKAKVVFTQNSVTKASNANGVVSGGAIGCNGFLEIGTDTEIKVVKVWHDGSNIDGMRPSMEKFANDVVVLANGQELSEDVKKNIQVNVMDLKDHPYVLSDNVIGYEGEALDYSDMDAWIVVISGLPTVDANNRAITYTISERKVPGYISEAPSEERAVHFNQDTYFELTNVHEPNGEGFPRLSLEATKSLVGRELADGEFRFELKDINGVIETKACDANGVAVFSPLVFDTVGTHTFTITEVVTDAEGITFDTSEHTVQVVVKDEGHKVTATTTYTRNGEEVADVAFANEAEPTGTFEPVSADLELAKSLEGEVLEDGQFTFHLYGTTGELLQTKTNDAKGVVLFDPLTFNVPGTYTYQVREDEDNPTITYDNAYHVVTFHVHDAGEGKLTVTKSVELDGEEVDALAFDNEFDNGKTYDAIGIKPEPRKVLKGRALKDGEFSFKLDGIKGDTIQVKENTADGRIAFDEVSVDKPGTYVFTLAEVQGNAAGVTYDERTYLATINVREGSDGTLAADPAIYTLMGKEVASATFENSAPGDKSSLVKAGDKQFAVVQLLVAGILAAAAFAIARRMKATRR